MPAFATSRISTLEDVAIYTYDEDIPLRTVFLSVFEKHNGEKVLETKPSNPDYKDFMESILPDFDQDRVYVSDIKKLVNWYNSLIDHKILITENIKAEEEEVEAKKPVEDKTEE